MYSSSSSPRQQSFPALFARGGTSNGLIIRREVLPASQESWSTILPSAMGSPDPVYGRQLDGMGGGISSTSKICVISRSQRDDADVDFTFVQVGIRDGKLDLAGNCGNMISVVAPAALDEGVVTEGEGMAIVEEADDQEAKKKTGLVRIFNTNTSKIIHSRFRLTGDGRNFDPRGDYEMDGVPGTGSRIALSFVRPAGAKTGKALPTGNAVDELRMADGSVLEVSLVDVANPGVFVRVTDLGLDLETLTPALVEADANLKTRLEEIRRAGASAMCLDPDVQSVPKIVLVASPSASSSSASASTDIDLRCLALSMGQAHKAVPLTLALCLGAASKISGTIPSQLLKIEKGGDEGMTREKKGKIVRIGHPSGNVDIGTTLDAEGAVESADLHRTARMLMRGEVFF